MPSLVYLAGTIAGHTYDDATSWRRDVHDRLAECGIQSVSPMRGKAGLQHLTPGDEPLGAFYAADQIMSTPQAIMQRDFFDVARADLVFAYLLGAPRVSIGTMMELAWAYSTHKPVVIVADEGGLHDHPFVRQTGFWVPSLEEGIQTTVKILATGVFE